MVQPRRSFNDLLAISDSACRSISLLAGIGGATPVAKADVGAWGLRSPNEGRTFGLCTETLGSESSSDEFSGEEGEEAMWTTIEEEEEEIENEEEEEEEEFAMRRAREAKTFPPPLPSLMNAGAARHAFMRAERKDGRLILTPVTVERPRIFRACRHDGRLRLELIRSDRDVKEEVATEAEAVAEEEEEKVHAEGQEQAQEEEDKIEDEDGDAEFQSEGSSEAESEEEAKAAMPFKAWEWLRGQTEGCYNRRCNDVSTATAVGRGAASGLFWNNPRFMTTA